MAQRSSILYEQYAAHPHQSFNESEPISPLRASIDPRFSSLLTRAAANRERLSQQKVSPNDWTRLPSTSTTNYNAWSPETSATKLETSNPKSQKCLTPTWKNRLQGLAIGLLAAAIATGIVVAVFLTRPSTDSTSTTTPTTGCGSLKWDPTGVTVAGNGIPGSAMNQLYYPQGVYVDSNNVIYVADTSNSRIQQWLPNAINGSTVAGVTGFCASGGRYLCSPTRIYGDSQQNLYIADSNGIYLCPFNSSNSTLITGTSTGIIGSIYGIFVDTNRNLYASISFNQSVMMWTSNATVGTIVAGGNSGGYSSSQLYNPYGLTVDSSTNTIYVSGYTPHTIVAWKIGSSTGSIIAGRNATFGGGSSSLRNPRDVKRDSNGNLYVADTGNNRILLFCQNPPSTTAITIVDTGLNNPFSIALDSNSNIYVADYTNHRIQKFNRIT